MGIRIGSACALVALAVAATTARANMLVNGGLEMSSGYVTPSNPGFLTASATTNATALPGWTITSNTIDIVPKTYWQTTQGNYSVDLIGTPGIGSIRQLVNSTVAGTDYSLTFDWSANPETWAMDEASTVKILLMQAWNPSGTVMMGQKAYFLTDGTRTRQNMQYITDHFDFTATGPTLLVVSAVVPSVVPAGESASYIYMGPVVDNLDLEVGVHVQPTGGETVPEPASLGVLAVGLAGVLAGRRRSK